jgi:hypothetical protein
MMHDGENTMIKKDELVIAKVGQDCPVYHVASRQKGVNDPNLILREVKGFRRAHGSYIYGETIKITESEAEKAYEIF